MPGQGTPKVTLRVSDAVWQRFGEIADNKQRAIVLREFIEWYIRQPGATLPRRP